VRAAAHEAGKELQRKLGNRLNARWVPVENMHLTVRFIGHVGDACVPAVLDALSPPLPIQPFDLELNGCGVFPASGPPRVIWIGAAAGVLSLQAIHDEFDRRLLPVGFAAEARPFNAHLTLARIKDARRGSGSHAREAARAIRPRTERCRVAHATVFRSVLSPTGSRYEDLLRVECAP
jgi:2'-5' RNA ligase